MATNFPTPPTFANPMVVNPQTGENQFNPVWLQWFLVLAGFLANSEQGRIRDIIPVTSTGLYVPSNGTNNVLALLWGAGGGGGSGQSAGSGNVSVGGGGGAGGFTFGLLTTGFNNVPFTIGAGGGSDMAGGATTFAGLTANGGQPGAMGAVGLAPLTTLGGLGGNSSGGILNGYGANGLAGIALNATTTLSGSGASSPFGQGGQSVRGTTVGNAASGHAAGGGGGSTLAGAVGTGGVGGNGCGFVVELS